MAFLLSSYGAGYHTFGRLNEHPFIISSEGQESWVSYPGSHLAKLLARGPGSPPTSVVLGRINTFSHCPRGSLPPPASAGTAPAPLQLCIVLPRRSLPPPLPWQGRSASEGSRDHRGHTQIIQGDLPVPRSLNDISGHVTHGHGAWR